MDPHPPIPPSIEWMDGRVRLVDQRRLPEELVFIEVSTVDELCGAIASLAIRGAPALGTAGAMGVALAACRGEDLDDAGRRLTATRPTAINLRWGVERAKAAADPVLEAIEVAREDSVSNRRLGRLGAELLAGRGQGDDPLQRRVVGLRRLRHSHRRHPGGPRGR